MGNNVNDKGNMKEEVVMMPVLRKCKICVHLPILIDPVGY